MQTISDFFKHYKKHNGFPYNPNNDYYREFDELAYYMNWNQRAYDKNEKQFLEIEDQEYGYYYEGNKIPILISLKYAFNFIKNFKMKTIIKKTISLMIILMLII